jgi:hypothetical protein
MHTRKKKNTQRLKIPDGKNPVDSGEAKPRHEKTRERPEKKLLKNQRRNHKTGGRLERTRKNQGKRSRTEKKKRKKQNQGGA